MHAVNDSRKGESDSRMFNSRFEAGHEFLAAELSKEFSAPVALYDPLQGECLGWSGLANSQLPTPDPLLRQTMISLHSHHGRKRVVFWRPRDVGEVLWMVIMLRRDSVTFFALVGFATTHSDLPAAVGSVAWGPVCPEAALRAWGQSIAERFDPDLRRAAQPAAVPATSTANTEGTDRVVVARLIRRFRISDAPEKFQQLACNALRTAMNVKAITWVPLSSSEPVVHSGEIGTLKGNAFRALLPMIQTDGTLIVNNPESPADPEVKRMIAVAATTQTTLGWLIALNPRDERAFNASDTELLQPVASLIATQQANARVYSDLKELIFGVIRALTAAIDAKDPYTSGHSERVARIAVRISEELSMSPTQRGDLYVMGLLHDVGKIGVDDAVLKKAGPLTPDEYRQVQAHVPIGVHILSDLKRLSHLLPGVRHHHESYDGTGYPDGLAGEAIPFEARILAVADSYDAMSSTRPYRKRLSPGQIDDILRKGANVQWDPKIIDALFACRSDVEMIRQKGIGESLQMVVSDTVGRK